MSRDKYKDHDRELNAYLDGELSEEQRSELEALLERDTGLRERLDELHRVKRMVMHSFQSEPEHTQQPATDYRRLLIGGLAALVFVVIGFALGVMTQERNHARHVLLDDNGRAMQPSPEGSEETRIVFHLTNPDQIVAGELLDEVEDLLSQYRDQQALLRIEIVSHGEGLGLLRERLSKHQRRITALAAEFDNLAFVACQNSINRLRVEKGLEVTLVPEAEVIDSGVSHVVKRQMEGWSYIRV